MTGDTVILPRVESNPDQLLVRISAMVDDVKGLLAERGTVEGAEDLAAEARRLLTLVVEFEGLCESRAEMLRGAAEAAQSVSADPDPYAAAMTHLDEDEDPPRRRAWFLARWRGGGTNA